MKAKFYPFIGAVSALVLVLLNLAPGLVLVAEATAYEPSEPSEQVCVTIQRDTFGEVADSFIWSARPETNFNNASLYTGVGSSGEKRSLVHFGLDFLPESTIVQSATFGIWKYSPASEGTAASTGSQNPGARENRRGTTLPATMTTLSNGATL